MTTTLDYPIEYYFFHLNEPLELARLDGCRVLYLAELVIQELGCNNLIRKVSDNGVLLISEKIIEQHTNKR